MTETAGRKEKFGIHIKISIICGINVLVLLTVGSFILLNFEYSLTKFFVNEYIQKIEKTIAEQGERQSKLLESKYKVNSEILPDPQSLPHPAHHIEGSGPCGLVNEQKAVQNQRYCPKPLFGGTGILPVLFCRL